MTENQTCPTCGSKDIIPHARVTDQWTRKDLEARVYENPEAILLKRTHIQTVHARICGRCGNVELFVSDPQELWAAHQKAQTREDVT